MWKLLAPGVGLGDFLTPEIISALYIGNEDVTNYPNIYNKKLSNHFMRLTDQKNFERCAQIGHAESAEPSL